VPAAFRHGLHRHVRAPAHERPHGRYAQHDGVSNDAIHLVVLQKRLRERHGDTRLGSRRARLNDLDARAPEARRDNAGDGFPPAAVEDRNGVARAQPEHTRKVLRLVFWKLHLARQRKLRGVEPMHVWIVAAAGLKASTTCSRPYRILRPVFFRGQAVGKYKILSPLGSGGFGTVYLAEDTWIHKKVAIKVPHRQNVDFSDLLREPRLLASLNHPNIVSILTAEKQSNVFFIVMEYVPGDTLETVISRDGHIDLARTLDYTCQICNALDHAHQHGVIHRDLRPGNVLVHEGGVLKVADFGTSRFVELAAHGTTVIGSPPYMAPEQFHGKTVFASDIYSLGVTMYQMLTGVLPYNTPAPADLEKLMKGELVAPPRTRNPKIPAKVNDIVMKAVAPDVNARYQSAGELLRDLLAQRGRRRSTRVVTPQPPITPPVAPSSSEDMQSIHDRLRARETPQPRFCWHCRKPLQARSSRCPFCGEAQKC
jgi:eukaryotic-like serine/threonine-protein kinase